jgi:hypothetical protein
MASALKSMCKLSEAFASGLPLIYEKHLVSYVPQYQLNPRGEKLNFKITVQCSKSMTTSVA